MRRINFTNPRKEDVLHIEAPGCVVNVRIGLTTEDGRRATAVEVLADGYAGTGNQWSLPDHGGGRHVAVRVVQSPPKAA